MQTSSANSVYSVITVYYQLSVLDNTYFTDKWEESLVMVTLSSVWPMAVWYMSMLFNWAKIAQLGEH